MTALANSPVFWIGLLVGLATLYVLPTMIAVIRQAENIALVVFLNCLASRAHRGLHDAHLGAPQPPHRLLR